MKYILLAIALLAIFASPVNATSYVEATNVTGFTGGFNPLDDGYAGPLEIGFDFPFYGVNQTNFNVSTNGFITFTDSVYDYQNVNLTSRTGGVSLPSVFPFWDDLLINANGYIVYKAIAAGESGNPYGTDVLVIQWTNCEFYGESLAMGTFQVHLISDGNITFNYNDLLSDDRSYGTSATIGMQESGTSANYTQYSSFTDAGIRSGDAISFAYDGSNYTTSGASTDDFWNMVLYKNGSVLPPTKPYNPDPSLGATTSTSPTISWSCENATNYTVRVSVNADLSSPSSNDTTESSLALSSLSENTTYYWHVIASNAGGETHSDLWKFTTGSVPVANFSSNVTSGAIPLAVNFTDLSTNAPASWLWNFGDGNTSSSQNPTHIYVTPGTYNVSLNATNCNGSNINTQVAYITAAFAPVSNFTSNVTSGAVPLSVNFTDQSTNTPTSWLWNFGDGNTSTDQNPTHTYVAAGNYNVSLNATNVGGTNLVTQTAYITTAVAPVSNFTVDLTSGVASLAVSFTDFSTNTPTSWAWDFGDGSTSTDKNATHIYATAGTYTVSLNASNVGGSNVSIQVNYITVTAASSSSSSSSSSGTRASVSQGQDPAIVSSSASSVIRVTGGSEVNYDFSDSGTPVLGVSFDAQDDKGLVVAKVQVLSDAPEGVSSQSGNCYQMMSIDVGSEGTISSGTADNIMIRFKVNKQWIKENNIDVSTIHMTRYHAEQWNNLPTYQEREEGEYIYFYAETPGFSIFNVVGDTISETSEELVKASAPIVEEMTEPVEEEETKDTPGFTAIAGIVFVSLALLVSRKQKSE